MNESYQNIVTTFPPEKAPEGEAVLLKLQTRSGEVLRFRVSDAIDGRDYSIEILPSLMISAHFSVSLRM